MPRTKGAKNKPKSAEWLRQQLTALENPETRESEETVSEDTKTNTTDSASTQSTEQSPLWEAATVTEKAEPMNLKTAKQETDEWECGNCHAELQSSLTQCPHCGSGLSWG